MFVFREKTTLSLASFHAASLSRPNWNLEISLNLVLQEGGKLFLRNFILTSLFILSI